MIGKYGMKSSVTVSFDEHKENGSKEKVNGCDKLVEAVEISWKRSQKTIVSRKINLSRENNYSDILWE